MVTSLIGQRPTTPARVWVTALGVREADLAAAVGVSPSYLAAVLRGRRQPSTLLRRAMAQVLGVAEHDLWEGQP